jgi:hypothetical protein
LELTEVFVHPVEPAFPREPALLGPCRDLIEAFRVERAWPILGAMTSDDEPSALEHLDVLRDRGERQIERLGELIHSRLSGGETYQDRAPRRVR